MNACARAYYHPWQTVLWFKHCVGRVLLVGSPPFQCNIFLLRLMQAMQWGHKKVKQHIKWEEQLCMVVQSTWFKSLTYDDYFLRKWLRPTWSLNRHAPNGYAIISIILCYIFVCGTNQLDQQNLRILCVCQSMLQLNLCKIDRELNFHIRKTMRSIIEIQLNAVGNSHPHDPNSHFTNIHLIAARYLI